MVGDEAAKKRTAVKRCLTQIKLYEKEYEQWTEECKKIHKRYRAEKQGSTNYAYDSSCQFNLFWSNLQLQHPSLYARTPVAQIERRNKDKEFIPRFASEILERATRFEVQSYKFDDAPSRAVLDLLLTGRGIARIRYKPTIEGEGEDRVVTAENTVAEYVAWQDFQHNSARTWDEVDEVRFKNYYSKVEAENLFGEKLAKKLKYTHLPSLVEENEKLIPEDEQETYKKAVVWEIWDKKDKAVKWVSKDYTDDYLKVIPDPLELKGFFPCPSPLYGTLTNDSLIPVPDARQVKKLYDELDEIEAKISALTTDLKTSGVYPAHHPEIARLYDENEKLIPVRDWAGLQKDGSLGEIIQFLPVKQVVEALQVLYEQKNQLKQDIYEITGNADIMRGVTETGVGVETQQLKAQFGSVRLVSRQRDVQRFVRDLIALTAEIIAEHYSEETLVKMTGLEFIPNPPPPPPGPNGEPPPPLMPEQIQEMKLGVYRQALEILRDDPTRRFKIDIETDSTIAINETQAKADKAEMLQSVTGFLQQMIQIRQGMPEALPLCGEMLQEVVRTYRCGRNLENAIEEFVEQAKQAAEAAKNAPPAPDPKMIEAQGKMALEQAKSQHSMQIENMKAQHDIQLAQAKAALEQTRAQFDAGKKLEELRNNVLTERAQLAHEMKIKEIQAAADIQIQQHKAALDAELAKKKEVIQGSHGSGGGSSSKGNSHEVSIKLQTPGRKKLRVHGPNGPKEFEIEDVEGGEH